MAISFAVRFLPTSLRNQRPPVAQSFCFAFSPAALLYWRPPVAPSFAARRKIEEKGVPKGSKAALWILAFYTGVWRGDVRKSYEFALVQFTRFRPARGVWRAHCFHGLDCTARSAANRWHFKNNRRNLLSAVGWLRKCHPFNRTAARRAHGSSAEHAMRDLIASNAPLRGGRHKARQNPPKHYPGDSRGRSPLARLSPLSFVVQRKMGPPEGLPKRECR